ncbi:MAG: hypothetical protein SFW08_12200 [Gemmatimonadaceae bacterium]|nr:hypothetical protein [Gemmatimonadaceae bacterium]
MMTSPAGPDIDHLLVDLSPEERDDVMDAVDQDKELRWLERDASLAEHALLHAPDGIRGEDLRRLHRAHSEAQQRLAAAHAAILGWLEPQFARRRNARLTGHDALVLTREEFRILTLEERDQIDRGGRDSLKVALELKAKAREVLAARGWKPRSHPERAGATRAPVLVRSAWRVRGRLEAIFAAAASR